MTGSPQRRSASRGRILVGLVLTICMFASLVMVFVPRFRLAGLVGLAVIMVLGVVWALALRRSRVAAQSNEAGPRQPPDDPDLDEANPIWNQPTWRDDANGRVGPKW